MNMDKISEILQDPNVVMAEIVIFKSNSNGDVVRETVTIDYYSDGDYQWSKTTKPILVE